MSHEKNNILFVVESFFPSQRAGTEVYVLNLSRHFIAKGWEASVLISDTSGRADYTYECIPVYTFQVPKEPISKELNGILPPRGIENFEAKLKAIQPNWVHFHSFGRAINTYHLKLAKELGYKTAFTPHLGSFFCIKGDLRLFNAANCNGKVEVKRCTACLIHSKGKSEIFAKSLGTGISWLTQTYAFKAILPPAWFQARHRKDELRRMAENADIVFAIAPWIKAAFEANGFFKAQLIPQGISSLFLIGNCEEHKPIRNPINLVFVGRMHSSKGFHLLKEAFEQLGKPNQMHLHILTNPSGGETDYYITHKKWAEKQENVTWNESFSQKQVADYLNDMDVLVLPSISNEVAPLVILEAATRKIPTLASDYIAMKDMIQHGVNGWLFENGNSSSLKKLLLEIINHPGKIIEVSKNISRSAGMDDISAIVESSFITQFK